MQKFQPFHVETVCTD